MSILKDIYVSRRPLAGFCAIGIAWAIYFAQMPVIKANVGASDGYYGAVMLIAAFGAVAAMWLAPAARQFAKGLSIPIGIAVLAIGMMGASLSTGLAMLAIAMFLASAGSGIVDVLINARVAELEQEKARSLMNLNQALYSFAYAAGALITSFLRNAGVTPVPIFIGLAVVLTLLAWYARDTPPELEEEAQAVPTQMPNVLVILIGLIVLMAFLAEASTEGWSALHLERTLNGSAGVGALGPAMLGLMMGIGRLSGHGLSKRFKDTHLMFVSTLVAASGIALAALAQSIPLALLGFAIGGLGISAVAPLALGLIGRIVPPAQRLTAVSRPSGIGLGAFFFGPSLMGFISELFSLPVSFLLISLLLVTTAFVLIPAMVRNLRR